MLDDALGVSSAKAVRTAKKLNINRKRSNLRKSRRKWGSWVEGIEIRRMKQKMPARQIAAQLLRQVRPLDPGRRIVESPRVW